MAREKAAHFSLHNHSTMFRTSAQRTFQRFNSGHVSKFIKDDPFKHLYNKEAGDAFKNAYDKKKHHSVGVTALWKKITFFVAFPVVILTAIPVGKIEIDHAHHREHMKHLSDEEWPVQYEYQNLRQKKFFWGDGDKTLFWNLDINRHIE